MYGAWYIGVVGALISNLAWNKWAAGNSGGFDIRDFR